MMKSAREFWLLQISSITSGIGNGIFMIALPWLVLDRTGSPAAAGLVAALSGLPGIFVAPLIGLMIDKIGRRVVSIGGDVMSGISVLLFVTFDRFDILTYGWIVALAVFGSIFDPAGHTARKSLIPSAAQACQISLEKANSRHEGLFALGWALGPACGAVLIKWTGPINAMLGTSSLFAIAALSVLAMRVGNARSKIEKSLAKQESFLKSTVSGLRALRQDRALFTLTFILMFVSAIYMPIESVILPVHFERLGNPGGLGATMSSLAAGMVIGAFGFEFIAKRLSRYTILRVIMVGVAIVAIPLAMLPATPLIITLGFLMGLTWGPFNPLWNTLIQVRVPSEIHGRVYGVQMSMLYAALPLGQFIVGVAVEYFGLRLTSTVVAAMFSITAIMTICLTQLRDLSTQPETMAKIKEPLE